MKRGEGISSFASLCVVITSVMLSSCSQELPPREIPFDRANCARCGMMVSDPANAAQAVFADDDPRFYDDIGCLVQDVASWKGRVQAYARSVDRERWLAADRAFYGRPLDVRTPMGFDFLVYETAAEAAEHDRDGRGRSWQELRAEIAAGAP